MIEIEKYNIVVCINNYHIDTNLHAIELDIAINVNDIGLDINGICVTRRESQYSVELPTLTYPTVTNRQSIRFYEYSIWAKIVSEIKKNIEETPWIQIFFSYDQEDAN